MHRLRGSGEELGGDGRGCCRRPAAAVAVGKRRMIAVDTNVLVRYVTNDDPVQARKAADLLAGPETILIAHSVLLELEWVLRAVYELSRPAILKAMRQVLGLPGTHVEQAISIA